MCVVSFIGDEFGQRWPVTYPWVQPLINPQPYIEPRNTTAPIIINPVQGPSQEEFDKLKTEVELMKQLLIGAKEYDKRNNEPDCEIDDKVRVLKEIARLVGVDLGDVFEKSKP